MSELAQIIQEIQREIDAAPAAPEGFPGTLPLDQIMTLHEAFQHRSLCEMHVNDLLRALRAGDTLDPITVLKAGQSFYVIDGHHRIEAYRRSSWKEPIPVQFFRGSAKAAVAEAGRLNSRNKLAMTADEKMNLAWRMVTAQCFSKAQIRSASGVSDGTVANMRRVMEQLGSEAAAYDSWPHARHASQGEPTEWTDEQIEMWRDEKARADAEKLFKAFGKRTTEQPEAFARALEIFFGSRISRLYDCLGVELCRYELDADF